MHLFVEKNGKKCCSLSKKKKNDIICDLLPCFFPGLRVVYFSWSARFLWDCWVCAGVSYWSPVNLTTASTHLPPQTRATTQNHLTSSSHFSAKIPREPERRVWSSPRNLSFPLEEHHLRLTDIKWHKLVML